MSKREIEIATNIAAMLAQFATEAHELFFAISRTACIDRPSARRENKSMTPAT